MRNFFSTISIYFLGVLLLASPFALHAAGGLIPCDGTDCDLGKLIKLVENILRFFSYTVAFVAAALFAWGGILYMTAGGNESQIKNAHKIFGYAAGGLVLVLAAWLIVYTIMIGLGVDSKFWFLSR
ncbi:MAG: hypothetical protein H8D63_01550 [Parcubacteria group bacterium]|nr:hypothetical protein [Parcubacteria group bacterium]